MSNLRAGPIWSVRLPVLNIPWNPKDSHGWTPGNPLSESLGITRNPAKLGVGPRNLSFQRRPRFDVGSILKLPLDVLKFRVLRMVSTGILWVWRGLLQGTCRVRRGFPPGKPENQNTMPDCG